jgi:hypothetical protein
MARVSKTMDIDVPKHVVNRSGSAKFRIFGSKGMTEIWFPPYMTNMAPTRTDGEATPMSTPAALDTAIMDRLVERD